MLTRHFVLAAGLLAALPAVSTAAVQVIVLSPLSGQAHYTGQTLAYPGSWSLLTTAPTNLLTSEARPRKAILEYPLADLPSGAVVTSATLALPNVQAASGIIAPGGPCQLTFHGYSGNGIIEPADATVPANPVGNTAMLYGGGSLVAVTLNPGYLQSLLDASDTHLGLAASQTGDYTGQVRFDSTSGATPELTVTFVPEPASALSAAAAVTALIHRRQRRTSH